MLIYYFYIPFYYHEIIMKLKNIFQFDVIGFMKIHWGRKVWQNPNFFHHPKISTQNRFVQRKPISPTIPKSPTRSEISDALQNFRRKTKAKILRESSFFSIFTLIVLSLKWQILFTILSSHAINTFIIRLIQFIS